jgi:tetratricopeptide (TPR) repeat protein
MFTLIRASICALLLGIPFSLLAADGTATRLGTDTEAPPQRLALLVGNSNYEHLNTLKNPKNEVDQLAAKLHSLGFQTTVKYDLNHDDFVDALTAFENRIEPGAIALFYYSGHGVDLGGNNYLIPVNMPVPSNEGTVEGRGISLQYVRERLNAARLSLIILDACRTYPTFQVKSLAGGLAAFFPKGTLVAYAADEGQAASDNDVENISLFTKYLIAELGNHDETLCQLFQGVRAAVDKASHNVQFPFVYDGVIVDFVFNPTATAQSRKLAALGRKHAWTTIQDSDDPNYFAAFLAPSIADSGHLKAAEVRLSSLMSSTVKAVGVVPVDPQSSPEVVSSSNQAERLFYEGAYRQASETYLSLGVLRPGDVSVLFDYGTCLLHLGRGNEAIPFFSRAIELDPKFPWAYYNRAVAYHMKGDFKDAIDDYTRGLERRPSYAPGYNNLALAKRDSGNLAGAQQDVQKAIALDPHYAPAFFNGANILTDSGDLKAAGLYLDKGKTLTIPVF